MTEKIPSRAGALLGAFASLFDSEAGQNRADPEDATPPHHGDPVRNRVDWVRMLPLIALHLGCVGVLWVGWSPIALVIAAALYFVRMFAITGFYHRYFSHRTFRTGRIRQFLFAVLGNSAAQRGPLWWASHHRHHHSHSDEQRDTHSPTQHGMMWSHFLWIACDDNFATRKELVRDLRRYPELRFLDRFDVLVPALLLALLYGVGAALETWLPGLGTSGLQLVVWGFFLSTVVLFHATCTINSLSHRFGRRRYETDDDSRNSLLLALLTFGEGWHNNHHYYPQSARQGFRWYEIDLTYYLLRILAAIGVIDQLRPVPARVLRDETAPTKIAQRRGSAPPTLLNPEPEATR